MKTKVIDYLLDMYPQLDSFYVSALVNAKYDSIVKLHNRINDKYGIVTELTIDMVAMLLTADMLRDGTID